MKKHKLNIPLQMLLTLALCFALQACGEKKEDKTTEKPEVATNEDKEDFIQIFDGKTLKGWEGDPKYWSVKNGNLTGEVTPETLLKNNTFCLLYTSPSPRDGLLSRMPSSA